jgi:uncharacterized protein (TIGR00106 family)
MAGKDMHIIADFQVIPIGVGASLSNFIADCEKILEESNLTTALHTMGTNIEGDWDDILAAVKRCHEELHQKGVPRVVTALKLSSRIDREQSIHSRIKSVEDKK